MKKTMLVLAAALVFSAGTSMQAQSLKDLLNKDNIKNVVSAVADRLDIIPENIAGTWEYSGAAVEFTSDNTLAGAASVLASGKVEEKLDEYLAKIGLEDGLFVYTFNADSTFSTTFKKSSDEPLNIIFEEPSNAAVISKSLMAPVFIILPFLL